MNIDVFFNPNYVSSNNYIKVSCRIENKGIFAVVYNPLTKKTQCQRYAGTNYNERKVLIGNHHSNKYIFFPINLVAENNHRFSLFSEEELNAFKACVDDMYFACKKYMQLDTSIVADGLEMELIDKVRTFRKDFEKYVIGGESTSNSNTTNISTTPKNEWQSIDPSDLLSQDLVEIANLISQYKNPDNGVEYGGKRYRIINDEEQNELIFQIWTDEENTTSTVQPTVKVRKFIKMAKMVNADGLTDFIDGNFYEIKNILNFDGKQYYEITDCNGVNHHIHDSRMKQVAVYIEPPTMP